MATNLNIDNVTYELKEDAMRPKTEKKRFYIRAGYPLNYITGNMTKRNANLVAKSMRQLGLTVTDKTKGV